MSECSLLKLRIIWEISILFIYIKCLCQYAPLILVELVGIIPVAYAGDWDKPWRSATAQVPFKMRTSRMCRQQDTAQVEATGIFLVKETPEKSHYSSGVQQQKIRICTSYCTMLI